MQQFLEALGQRGNGAIAAPLPALMRAPSRSDIVEWVKQHEDDTRVLRNRYQNDYELYRLAPHVNLDPVSGEPLREYSVYTSNAPKTYADKIISWETMAELILRVPHVSVGSHSDEQDNLKERFAIGCLKSADERLARVLQPSLRGALAFYVAVRGGYVGGRCLLVKRDDGSTYVDITPWDPLNTYWAIGSDGLEWVCHKIKKTKAQIRREYGKDLDSDTPLPMGKPMGGGSQDAEHEGIWVYDFYDRHINKVVTQHEDLKPERPHGSPRVPCYLQLVGPVPLLQAERSTDLVKDVGESVYSGLRGLYERYNDVMSVMLELVSRARSQSYVIESPDGRKTLPYDPHVVGTGIPLARGERIYTVEMQKLAQDTGVYIQMIAGEIQRGSLPYSAWGELQFQLSGFAITQLRQGIETLLSVRIDALEAIYLQVANLLYDQFMTGAFDGVRLSGQDSGRNYFNLTITPEQLKGTCDFTVRLVSQLPQDDMGKWAMAQIAKHENLLSDIDIHDNVLGTQDSQQALDKVWDQMAKRGLPEATLYSLGMAAARRGDAVIANMYLAEYQRLTQQKLGILPPDSGSNPQGPGTVGGPGGQRPEVLPNAAQGGTPSPLSSNNGPSFVAPQTPRLGARQGP